MFLCVFITLCTNIHVILISNYTFVANKKMQINGMEWCLSMHDFPTWSSTGRKQARCRDKLCGRLHVLQEVRSQSGRRLTPKSHRYLYRYTLCILRIYYSFAVFSKLLSVKICTLYNVQYLFVLVPVDLNIQISKKYRDRSQKVEFLKTAV